MNTQMQTVQILFPFSTVEIQAMEEVPVCPVRRDLCLVRIVANETVTTWSPCGTVEQILVDGTVKTWWPKPSLRDAIFYRKSLGDDVKKGYFEFHKNGAVTSRSYGSQWYWGPTKQGVPVQGTLTHAHSSKDEWIVDECSCDLSCFCDTRPQDEPDPMFRYSFWTTTE